LRRYNLKYLSQDKWNLDQGSNPEPVEYGALNSNLRRIPCIWHGAS